MGDKAFIARLRAKVRRKWDPSFVGQGAQDLGDGPYPGQDASEPCANCKQTEAIKWRSSRTSYEWDGQGENPNGCLPLCGECAEDYNEQMDQQWSDYFSGLL